MEGDDGLAGAGRAGDLGRAGEGGGDEALLGGVEEGDPAIEGGVEGGPEEIVVLEDEEAARVCPFDQGTIDRERGRGGDDVAVGEVEEAIGDVRGEVLGEGEELVGVGDLLAEGGEPGGGDAERDEVVVVVGGEERRGGGLRDDQALDLAYGLDGLDDLEDAGDRVAADVAALGPAIGGIVMASVEDGDGVAVAVEDRAQLLADPAGPEVLWCGRSARGSCRRSWGRAAAR
jgi:hypothetical protein